MSVTSLLNNSSNLSVLNADTIMLPEKVAGMDVWVNKTPTGRAGSKIVAYARFFPVNFVVQ